MVVEELAQALEQLTDEQLGLVRTMAGAELARRERDRLTGTPCELCGQPMPAPGGPLTFVLGVCCWNCGQPVKATQL